MDATIVIPTKNASALLNDVLHMVFNQKTSYEYEVICVDSGSSDETLEIIRRYPCALFQIPPSEFGHGKTRRFGAMKGTGEFIIFITQDALPASDFWLENFLKSMKEDDDIAGGFGIHYPYPDCNIIDKRDLTVHFQNFGTENTVFQLNQENRERYENDIVYKQHLVFFSDNNSCIRRTVFEEHPYKDVDFAEDQIWAREIIELGMKKLYCATAPVFHSHNYPLSEYKKRYYDEFKGLFALNGYRVSTHILKVPLQTIKKTRTDLWYIRGQSLTKNEKLHWLWYAFRRNWSRFYFGYLGGQYASYSIQKQNRLDRKYSQQQVQRAG